MRPLASQHVLSKISGRSVRPWACWAGIELVLDVAILSGLLLALGCTSDQGMSFDATQASFRDFSRCVIDADLAGRLKFQDAWLQNVVTTQDYFGLEDKVEASNSEEPADESYVVTGVIRATRDNDPPRDDLAVLLVRKVLDKYKVVNWATNLEQDYERDIPRLSSELLRNPYTGKCTW